MSSSEMTMTIDVKWNRIRIHKKAIRAIGSPEKVLLLVNPEDKAIILTGTIKSDPEGHAPSMASIRHGRSFELHSKPLVMRLKAFFPVLSTDGVFQFRGNVIENENSVCFSAESVRNIRLE